MAKKATAASAKKAAATAKKDKVQKRCGPCNIPPKSVLERKSGCLPDLGVCVETLKSKNKTCVRFIDPAKVAAHEKAERVAFAKSMYGIGRVKRRAKKGARKSSRKRAR